MLGYVDLYLIKYSDIFTITSIFLYILVITSNAKS